MTTQRFVRAAVLIAAASWPAAAALQRLPPWTGGRSVPVHRIHLIDEFDQVIVPTGLRPLPFSARTTCGPCHDYPSIQGGLHFDAASSEPAGRPGQPWIWVDAKTGTVLPLSYRGWPGCWKPAQVGLSAWDVTLLFGRHMPGGGPGERGAGEADSESRWEVSGKLEINCLGCHNASRLQDHSEWAKQVLRENFRWAAAASSGLAEVGGMTSRLRATWDLFDGPNPDDREWAVAPSVAYDRDAFDGKHRVVIEIGDRPDDARCLDCHSVSAAGSMRFLDEGDVHSAAGLRCADCHRNDLSHAMIRGYEGEAEEAGRPEIGDFTCRGCHLGSRVGAGGTTGSGRLGAPYPLHRGLPPHHLDRLSCTACHSGSLPQEEPVRVRESRANRLGIHGVAQWATDYPHIQEPVFLRDVNGKLTPHRMTWPSFWGRIGGDGVQPLRPSQVMAVAGDEFDAEGRIARLLSALDDPEIGGIPVLVFRGKVYEPDLDGGLSASTYAGGIATAGPSLAVKKDGAVAPLIPAPDPAAAEAGAEAEAMTRKVLELLDRVMAPGERPALVHGASIYQVVQGALERAEWAGEPAVAFRPVRLRGDAVEPVLAEADLQVVAATAGEETMLTEEQVERALRKLRESDPGAGEAVYAYFAGGRMFAADGNGRLAAADHPAAEPVSWPLAHQVRPAQQSLGFRGCGECHSAGSSFFFHTVRGEGPLRSDRMASFAGHDRMKLSRPYQKLFGLSFTFQPLLKWTLSASGLLVGAMLLLALLAALARASGIVGRKG